MKALMVRILNFRNPHPVLSLRERGLNAASVILSLSLRERTG